MRQLYIKSILCAVISMLSLTANAYDCVVDGIYYTLVTSNKTAIVTYKDNSYNSYSGSVTIPESIIYNGKTYTVTQINGGAFRDCTNLTSVTIPNSITSIGDYAFQNCSSLASVTIPNSVEIIYKYAFQNCTSLTSINIPNSVTGLEKYAFYGCTGLTSATLGNGCRGIDHGLFCNCTSLKSITIPNNITEIHGAAFKGCTSLTSVTIPNSVTSIGSEVFSGCTSLTSIHIPTSVTSIGQCAFDGCTALKSVTIPTSVTSIENFVFGLCIGLISVTIPNSVNSIKEEAFSSCFRLKAIYSQIEIPFDIDESVFKTYAALDPETNELVEADNTNYTYETATLYVPKGTLSKYKNTAAWNLFNNIVEIDYEQSGIETVEYSPLTIEHYYTPNGVRIVKPQHGLNIIQMSDGTTRKVVIK